MSIPSQQLSLNILPPVAQKLVTDFSTGLNIWNKAEIFNDILGKASGMEREDALQTLQKDLTVITLINKSSFHAVKDRFTSIIQSIIEINEELSAPPLEVPRLVRQNAVVDPEEIDAQNTQDNQESIDHLRGLMEDKGLL